MYQLSGQHLSASGFDSPSDVVIADYDGAMRYNNKPFALKSGDTLGVIYEEVIGQLCQVKMRTISAAGSVSASTLILEGSSGAVLEPVISDRADDILAAWIEVGDAANGQNNWGHIRYQLITPLGQTLFANAASIPPDGSNSVIKQLKTINMGNGQTLLAWMEPNSSQIKVQLIGSDGSALWEPAGRVIYSGAYLNNNPLYLNKDGNAVLLLWSTGAYAACDVRGQRFENGEAVWEPSGRLLFSASSVPELGDVELVDIRGNYIIYYIGNYDLKTRLGVLCFDENGDPMPDYNSWGRFCGVFSSPYVGIFYYRSEVLSTGLLLYYGLQYVDYIDPNYGPQYGSDSYLQLIAPGGVDLWGGYGLASVSGYLLGADSSGFYMWQMSELKKWDYEGNLLWNQSTGSFSTHMLSYLAGVSKVLDSDYLVTYGTYYELEHFGFSTDGEIYFFTDHTLEDRGPIYAETSATLGNSSYTIWGNQNNLCSHLFLQRTSIVNSAADDPSISPPSSLRIAGSYPNPFTDKATIQVESDKAQNAELHVYNLKGQLVKELFKECVKQGTSDYAWDGKDFRGNQVGSGVYLLKLSGGETESHLYKILKIR